MGWAGRTANLLLAMILDVNSQPGDAVIRRRDIVEGWKVRRDDNDIDNSKKSKSGETQS